jgi:hypothetical protein
VRNAAWQYPLSRRINRAHALLSINRKYLTAPGMFTDLQDAIPADRANPIGNAKCCGSASLKNLPPRIPVVTEGPFAPHTFPANDTIR